MHVATTADHDPSLSSSSPALSPSKELQIIDTIQVKSCLDNPTYFHDPYAEVTGRDASGYVLAGLYRAIKFPSKQDPVVVWLVQRSGDGEYVHKKIFQDNGTTLSTASTAVSTMLYSFSLILLLTGNYP